MQAVSHKKAATLKADDFSADGWIVDGPRADVRIRWRGHDFPVGFDEQIAVVSFSVGADSLTTVVKSVWYTDRDGNVVVGASEFAGAEDAIKEAACKFARIMGKIE